MKADENVTCSYRVYASKLAIFSTFPNVQFAKFNDSHNRYYGAFAMRCSIIWKMNLYINHVQSSCHYCHCCEMTNNILSNTMRLLKSGCQGSSRNDRVFSPFNKDAKRQTLSWYIYRIILPGAISKMEVSKVERGKCHLAHPRRALARFSSSISRWTRCFLRWMQQMTTVAAHLERDASRSWRTRGRLSLNVRRGRRLVFGVDRDYFPHLPCGNPFPLISARCDDE